MNTWREQISWSDFTESSHMNKDDMKNAAKEALKEWLDDKFMQFGQWTAGALGAALLVAMLYFILKTNGWSSSNGSLLK